MYMCIASTLRGYVHVCTCTYVCDVHYVTVILEKRSQENKTNQMCTCSHVHMCMYMYTNICVCTCTCT